MPDHVLLLLLVSFLLLLRCSLCWPHTGPIQSRAAAKMRRKFHRLLKPRSQDDCPACCLASTASLGGGPAPAPVRLWSEVKSRRGAPKRVNTEGFALRTSTLVGHGKHGHAERIQTFRCQAYRNTFTSRRITPLYRLKTPSHQVAMVLTALAWLKGWTHPLPSESSAFD